MAIPTAEIKLGMDIISRIFKFIKSKLHTKQEKKIVSEIYRELLLGNKGDNAKIEALLLQIKKMDVVSPEYVRANEIFSSIKSSRHPSYGTFSVAKTRVAKKAAKTPAAKHLVKKSAVKRMATTRKRSTPKRDVT